MLRILLACGIVLFGIGASVAQVDQIGKGVDLGVHAATTIADQGGLLGSVAIAVGSLSLCLHALQGWAIVALYEANQTLQDKRAIGAEESTRQVASAAISGTAAISESSGRITKVEGAMQALGERLAPVPCDLTRIIAKQERILERLPRGAS